MSNQKMRLQKLYQTDSLFTIQLTKKTTMKGIAYQFRAQMQKTKLKKYRGQ